MANPRECTCRLLETVDSGILSTEQGPELWGCVGCAGNYNQLCRKLPDCGGLALYDEAPEFSLTSRPE